MKCLIREKLSEHKYKTPEGYLICVDSILARTGKQSYRRSELFQDGDDSEIDVDRPEDEVFSPATLASFENKPIVVEHPDEDVNASNIKQYAVGFVRDVKRGKTADGQDVMLGTLVIQDAETIEEIENGEHTDLSCGYDCDISDDANPTQRNIRGNHVALCAQGRAGIAKIVDSMRTLDFDAQLQENKLSKASIEYRKKMSEQPNNKKTLLLEAENIIEQIVDDTDLKDKATIRKYADKHLADIRAFAASLKDSVNDDAGDDWLRLLYRNNIQYEFINGGYGMRFKTSADYAKAKEFAKRVGYSKGHWHDKDMTHFDYSYTIIGNDSVDDKLIESSSKEALSKNIATEIKASKDPKQAAAIAYSIQKENDSMTIKDAKYAIWVKEKGQWKPWGSTDRDIDINRLKENFKHYEDVTLMPNDGSKPRDSINDGSPVDVLNVLQSKRDNTGKTWYLLEISMKSGTRAYIVTADYKGEKTYTGGGAVSFNLNTAKADMNAFITINELNTKYGQAEGYKRYMAGKKDSIEDSVEDSIKDFDSRILAALESVGKKGDAWWNKWKNIFNMTKGWSSYDWVQLAKRDPKKHDMLLKNRELATKEAKSIDAEWNRAIDALSRESGRYGTDFSGYKNDVWTSDVVAASSERVKEIKNDIAENQAFRLERAKSRRDADTFEEVTEELKKNEPNVDDIMNAVNAVKAVRRSR